METGDIFDIWATKMPILYHDLSHKHHRLRSGNGLEALDEYKKTMESVFGENHCYSLKIRPVGGTKVSKEM